MGDASGLVALSAACLELGCVLQDGKARGRVYGEGNTQDADYIIRVPSAQYDVLVTRKADGTLSLSTDFYNGSVAKVLGENLNGLVQGYQVARTIAEAQLAGYTVHKELGENQEIVLTIGGLP